MDTGDVSSVLASINAREVLEAVAAGVVIIDESQRIVYANRHIERLFGYRPEALLGQPLNLLLPERFAERHTQHMLAYLAAPRQRPMGIGLDLAGRRKDGSEFPVEVSLSYLRHPRLLVIAFVHDISQRHALEEALRRNNQELDAFAHTVAHDLKNPLSLIKGYTEYIIEGIAELTPLQVLMALEQIRQASDKMHHIIDELLLLASTRREDVKPEVVDMNRVLNEALKRFETSFLKRCTLPDQLPPALGYAPWIEEVWANYLSNALKYGGPAVAIGATPLPDGRIRYWVWDSGPGLTPEQQAQLFQEYQRLQRIGEGSGLGLSIVKRLVERMGGSVDVVSAPGEGTSFGFTLPAAPLDEVSEEESNAST